MICIEILDNFCNVVALPEWDILKSLSQECFTGKLEKASRVFEKTQTPPAEDFCIGKGIGRVHGIFCTPPFCVYKRRIVIGALNVLRSGRYEARQTFSERGFIYGKGNDT